MKYRVRAIACPLVRAKARNYSDILVRLPLKTFVGTHGTYRGNTIRQRDLRQICGRRCRKSGLPYMQHFRACNLRSRTFSLPPKCIIPLCKIRMCQTKSYTNYCIISEIHPINIIILHMRFQNHRIPIFLLSNMYPIAFPLTAQIIEEFL